jgi:hypothetical protein
MLLILVMIIVVIIPLITGNYMLNDMNDDNGEDW